MRPVQVETEDMDATVLQRANSQLCKGSENRFHDEKKSVSAPSIKPPALPGVTEDLSHQEDQVQQNPIDYILNSDDSEETESESTVQPVTQHSNNPFKSTAYAASAIPSANYVNGGTTGPFNIASSYFENEASREPVTAEISEEQIIVDKKPIELFSKEDVNQEEPSSGSPVGADSTLWEPSKFPALLYNGDLISTVDNRSEVSSVAATAHNQHVQNSLLRRDSIARNQFDLDLIKGQLSRQRSTRSAHRYSVYSDGNAAGAAATKEKVNPFTLRSGSGLGESAFNDDGHNTQNKPDPVDGPAYIEKEEQEQDQDADNEEELDEESLEKKSYDPVSHETELNCFKDFISKKKQQEVSLLPLNLKQQQPQANRRRTCGEYLKINKYLILIWILVVLIIAILCCLVPLTVSYSRGSESMVNKYLSNMTPTHRNTILSKWDTKASSAFTNKPTKSNKNNIDKATNSTTKSSSQQPKYQVPSYNDIGITKFLDLPTKYRNVPSIRNLMNNNSTQLKNIFYGVDYAPRNVIYPACGCTLHDVTLDMALLSQVTSRVRTYGTQCKQARYILESIKILNLNMKLSLGIWIGANEEINKSEFNEMKDLLQKFPRKYFDSIYIGNEVLFRSEISNLKLIEYIKEAKRIVQVDMKLDIPIGTSEIGSKADAEIMKYSDIFGINIHPFFTGDTVKNSVKWVYDFISYQISPLNEELKDHAPQLIISEVGWPYKGGKYLNSVASKDEFQFFLNNFICEAKKQNYPWFYFEAFDEPWKQIYHRDDSKWETEWGIFTADRKLKEGITLPDC